MVSNVTFGNGYNVPKYDTKDVENVVKYTMGTSLVDTEAGPFEGMGIMLGIGGAMEAFKGAKWLYKNGKEGTIKTGWANGVNVAKADYEATKTLFSNGGFKQASTYKTLWNNYSAKTVMDAIPSAEKLAKYDATVVAKFERARKFAEAAKLNNSSRLLSAADKALAEARFAAHGTVPATGFFGKIGNFFGKVTGASKASKAVKGFATKSPTVSKLLKFGKGNGIFLAITGAVELFTQVIPSFTQLGAGKGMKQLGKSTVKTGANVGGWVAGAAAGAAIGSVIPGAGTIIGGAIGSLCGLVGGFVGSWAAGKAADAVVGKNELDIAKEEEAAKLTQQVGQDSQALQQLMAAAGQKIQQEGASTPDSKIAFGSLSRLAASVPAQQTQATAPSTQNNTTNSQYAMNSKNIFGQQDYMDQDVMAMNAGLVQG